VRQAAVDSARSRRARFSGVGGTASNGGVSRLSGRGGADEALQRLLDRRQVDDHAGARVRRPAEDHVGLVVLAAAPGPFAARPVDALVLVHRPALAGEAA
jgi:hypothetical protein